MTNYKIQKFPDSRIASIDVCAIGKQKHHVTGLVEFDVTESRKKIREYNKVHSNKISFNAWLISVIGSTIKKHDTSGSYLIGKNKLIIFDDKIEIREILNMSILMDHDVIDGAPMRLFISDLSKNIENGLNI